jgi:hypothetical protein
MEDENEIDDKNVEIRVYIYVYSQSKIDKKTS